MSRLPIGEDGPLSDGGDSRRRPRIARRRPKPRQPARTVTDILKLLDYGWRHRAKDERFWLGIPPQTELVDELDRHIFESLVMRGLKTRWTDVDELPRRPQVIDLELLSILRENMRGTLFLLAHQLQRWMSEMDVEKLEKYRPDRFARLAEGQIQRLKQRLDAPGGGSEADAEEVHRLRIELRNAELVRDHCLALRPRKERGRKPKGPSDLAIHLLHTKLRKGLEGDWIEEVREAPRKIGLLWIGNALEEALDGGKKQRIGRALWSPSARQARTLDMMVRRILAAYLNCSERTVRRALERIRTK